MILLFTKFTGALLTITGPPEPVASNPHLRRDLAERWNPAPARLTLGDHHLAEGEAGDGDEFEIGDGERDAHDRDGLRGRRGHMTNGQPQARNNEPHNIHEPATGTRAGLANYCPAERPQNVARDTEAGERSRDRDDRDQRDHTPEDVPQEQWNSAKNDPNDVEKQAHNYPA